MIDTIDTATSQRNLNWDIAWAEGFRANYTKMGGDNVGRYVAPWYAHEIDQSHSKGFVTGHYWVPDNRRDPVDAADYFVNNLRGWTSRDFAVLDNESLDGSVRYNDAQAAAWINRVKQRLGIPGKQVKIYSGLGDARGTAWPNVLSTGTQFIIAAYSYPPFQFPVPGTIPANRIDGHQYGGRAIGGVVTDVNVFKDDSFKYNSSTAGGGTTPIPKEELIDMPIVVWNTKSSGVYTMGQEYIRHETYAPNFSGANSGSTSGLPSEGANYVVNVTSANDAYIIASESQFFALLDSFGIPRNRIASDGTVVPAGGGEGVAGANWSSADEVLVALSKLSATGGVTDAQIEQIAEKTADKTVEKIEIPEPVVPPILFNITGKAEAAK